jgi:hypothetical protein
MREELQKPFPLYVDRDEFLEEDRSRVGTLNVLVLGKMGAGKTEVISGTERALGKFVPTAVTSPNLEERGTVMIKSSCHSSFVRFWDFPGFEHFGQSEFDRVFHAIGGNFMNCDLVPRAPRDQSIVLTKRAGVTFSDMMHVVLLVFNGQDQDLVQGRLKAVLEPLREHCRAKDIKIVVAISHNKETSRKRVHVRRQASLAACCAENQVFFLDAYEADEHDSNYKKNIEFLRVALNCRRAGETYAATHFQRLQNQTKFRAEAAEQKEGAQGDGAPDDDVRTVHAKAMILSVMN